MTLKFFVLEPAFYISTLSCVQRELDMTHMLALQEVIARIGMAASGIRIKPQHTTHMNQLGRTTLTLPWVGGIN